MTCDCAWHTDLRVFKQLSRGLSRSVEVPRSSGKNGPRCKATSLPKISASWRSVEKNTLRVKDSPQKPPVGFSKIFLPETNNSPLKIGHPKMESSLPIIHFQVRTVSFREGILPTKKQHRSIFGKKRHLTAGYESVVA